MWRKIFQSFRNVFVLLSSPKMREFSDSFLSHAHSFPTSTTTTGSFRGEFQNFNVVWIDASSDIFTLLTCTTLAGRKNHKIVLCCSGTRKCDLNDLNVSAQLTTQFSVKIFFLFLCCVHSSDFLSLLCSITDHDHDQIHDEVEPIEA